jgi:hypothetical protein
LPHESKQSDLQPYFLKKIAAGALLFIKVEEGDIIIYGYRTSLDMPDNRLQKRGRSDRGFRWAGYSMNPPYHPHL